MQDQEPLGSRHVGHSPTILRQSVTLPGRFIVDGQRNRAFTRVGPIIFILQLSTSFLTLVFDIAARRTARSHPGPTAGIFPLGFPPKKLTLACLVSSTPIRSRIRARIPPVSCVAVTLVSTPFSSIILLSFVQVTVSLRHAFCTSSASILQRRPCLVPVTAREPLSPPPCSGAHPGQ